MNIKYKNPVEVWWQIYPKLKPKNKELWLSRGPFAITKTIFNCFKKSNKQQKHDLEIIKQTFQTLGIKESLWVDVMFKMTMRENDQN